MTSAKFIYLLRGLILSVAIAPAISMAGTVYNSFLPGNTYQCCGGQEVTGSSATNGGVLLGQFATAGAFTPTGNYTLTRIDVAFYFANGAPDTNGFTLSLNQDSGGVPGTTAIETWTGLTAPAQSNGTSSVVQTVFPVSTVLLLAGNQYWIVASPATSTTFDIWADNALDGTGQGGRSASNLNNTGWSVFNLSVDGLAFDVQGTAVPEPGPLTLVSSALIGLGLIGKRRRF